MASLPVQAPLDAVPGEAVPGLFRSIAFGLAIARPPHDAALAKARLAPGHVAHFVGSIGDEPTDGAHARRAVAVLLAETLNEGGELLLAQIGMGKAQTPDLSDQGRWPLPAPQTVWTRRARAQMVRLPTAGPQLCSPRKQRPA